MTPSSASERRVGIVDLGSNTARLVVYTCTDDRWFQLTDSIRERVRLAAGMDDDGRLQPRAIERALAALQMFADFGSAAGIEHLEVFATSAVRDAANGPELVREIEGLGLRVRVLSGTDEARLAVSAVANGFSSSSAWVVDLGGGSAQVSHMKDREFAWGGAHPLGAVRLTERFLGLEGGRAADPPSKKKIARLEREIARHLEGVVSAMRANDHPLIALGGTVRNLASAVQSAEGYPLSLLHGYRVERRALEELTEEQRRRTIAERSAISGINPDRADVILAGALVFRWILEHGERDHLTISGDGVREGALFHHLLPSPHRVDDVRGFALGNLFHRYRQPTAHTEAVRRLSRELFDELQPLHGLDERERELLDAAALLHDVGMAISYYGHHKHGAFLIESSGLAGHSHRELAMIALLVRYHRKGNVGAGALQPLLEDGDLERVRALAICLRLAEHLERSRSGRIRSLSARIRKQSVLLELSSPTRPTVEMWQADKDARAFEATFGRRLEIAHDASGR